MTISSVYAFAIRSLMFPPSMHINQRSIYGVWGGFLSPYLGLWLYCFVYFVLLDMIECDDRHIDLLLDLTGPRRAANR